MHIRLHPLCRAGIFPIIVFVAPGAQGATVAGIQGIGVRTPIAAAVAAETVGFAKLLHIANPEILANGLLSIMVPAGGPPAKVVADPVAINAPGAIPKVHKSVAPVDT